jgi:N-acetyl-alpha-D-muramate 1-phosphate uridylyltransferase
MHPEMGYEQPMQCVILAGGLATRMRPLTDTLPKALIVAAGRPFIDHQLEWLARVGVTKVLLSVGYRGEMLCDHVGDGSRWGLTVSVVDEGAELRGTGGALRLAFDRGALDESFLVTYGDSFLPIDFSAVWRAFLACGKPALMTVFRNAGRWDQSNAVFHQGQVFYDKTRRSRPVSDFEFIDYGLSALERAVVPRLVPAQGKHDLATVFHELSQGGQLAGFEVDQRFYEIGSTAGLADFEQWLTKRA